jgi:predicted GH43/DUF377 family glycosyl hydrolase
MLVSAVLVFSALYPGTAMGMDWIKYQGNPVLMKSLNGWDSQGISAACIIRDGEVYRLWYSATGPDGSGIGAAESADGLSWAKSPQNPLLVTGPEAYDSNFIFAPTALRDGNVYKMWYTGSDESSIWSICLATSEDGITWDKFPANPVLGPSEWYDGERTGDPWVIYDEGIYKMWYTCQNRPEIMYAIAYATSPDGVSWTKHPEPVLVADGDGPDNGTVRDPSVIRSGTGYEMWYRGIGKSGDWTVCYATSPDGISWDRYPENPVLAGDPDGWDARIWFPRVLDEGNRYSMWYTSADEDEIGYAHLPIGQGLSLAVVMVVLGRMIYVNRER